LPCLPEEVPPETAASGLLFAQVQGDELLGGGDHLSYGAGRGPRIGEEIMEKLTTPKVDKARMLAWLDQAMLVGLWPASIDQCEGKFRETCEALRALVLSSNDKLTIHVVHEARVEGNRGNGNGGDS
jgi:hypothetical protein